MKTKELNKALAVSDLLSYAQSEIVLASREARGLHYQHDRLLNAISWLSKAIQLNEMRLSNLGELPKNILVRSKVTGRLEMFDRVIYDNYLVSCKEANVEPEFSIV